MRIFKLIIAVAFVLSSSSGTAQSKREKSIQEINAAENAFVKMAAEKGIQDAFVYYAAEDAIIKRGKDSLIMGKSGIKNFYANNVFKLAELTWSPNFTDAAESGDLGYTIGNFTWKLRDAEGKLVNESNGVFHTVWKKQPDGNWKFVWD